MINNLDGKSKKELIEIVQIQMDEYQKLQQSNDEAQLLIGLLVRRSKQEVIDSVNDLYGMMASTMKPISMSECLDQIEQELNK